MTIVEEILHEMLSGNDIKVCVDFNNPHIKREFCKRVERMTFTKLNPKSYSFSQAMAEYKREYYQINITKFVDDRGYFLRYGSKMLFAIKENVLNFN